MRRWKWAALFAAILLSASALGESDFKLTGYASFDVTSGYVLYGGLENDEPCYWSYLELAVKHDDFGSLGAALWQSTDMTTCRKAMMRRMNEWDYYLFYRNSFALSKAAQLNFETGIIWYKFHGLKKEYESFYHTCEEVYVSLALENDFLTPHFHGFYDFKVANDAFFYGGVRRKVELPLGIELMPDVVIGGGGKGHMRILFPPFDGTIDSTLAYFEASLKLGYWFNDYFGIHARVAWVSLLDDDLRRAVRESDSSYKNDYVWGNIGVDFAF